MTLLVFCQQSFSKILEFLECQASLFMLFQTHFSEKLNANYIAAFVCNAQYSYQI